jgi:putative FmdB family regulatory protein
MPEYVFSCDVCGQFELWLDSGRVAGSTTCPECGRGAERVFTLFGLSKTPASLRSARNLEEQSAHEPIVASEKCGHPLGHKHQESPPWVLRT